MTPFDDILLPRRLRLLAFEVQPVTVFHAFLLETLGSPYIAGGTAGMEDFAVAACILSRPVRAYTHGRDWKLPARFLRWLFCRLFRATPRHPVADELDRAKLQALNLVNLYSRRPDAYKTDSAALSAWIADACRGYRVKTADGTAPQTPFAYSLSILLRSSFGMDYETSMRWPLKQAILDFQTLSELRGSRRIISAATARLLDRIAADKAENEWGQP
jgi:hypothetical protein